MPDVDTDRLIWIVVGVQLNAELGDRPLAYRVEQEVRERLAAALPAPADGELPALVPAVISDVLYLNNESVQDRPTISIGGPGVNALAGVLTDRLPAALAIENQLVIQMDQEMPPGRRQCAVWGMDHLQTVRAVDLFCARGYLDTFVRAAVAGLGDADG